jgi:hypothetical protein
MAIRIWVFVTSLALLRERDSERVAEIVGRRLRRRRAGCGRGHAVSFVGRAGRRGELLKKLVELREHFIRWSQVREIENAAQRLERVLDVDAIGNRGAGLRPATKFACLVDERCIGVGLLEFELHSETIDDPLRAVRGRPFALVDRRRERGKVLQERLIRDSDRCEHRADCLVRHGILRVEDHADRRPAVALLADVRARGFEPVGQRLKARLAVGALPDAHVEHPSLRGRANDGYFPARRGRLARVVHVPLHDAIVA